MTETKSKMQKPGIQRILMAKDGKFFAVKNISEDYHCQYGQIKKEDLKKKQGIITTNTGKELSIFQPYFIDSYKKIKRGAQIIARKDIGAIMAETGIDRTWKVLDAGAGSGALACMLANIAKEVTTYDIREDHLELVKGNIEFLGLKNVKTKLKDIYQGIDEKNLDLIVFDLPEPWLSIEHASKALKFGGFLISYSPSIPQTMDFVNHINKSPNFSHIKTIELSEKEWEIEDRKVRPHTQQLGHTGFLSFARKIA